MPNTTQSNSTPSMQESARVIEHTDDCLPYRMTCDWLWLFTVIVMCMSLAPRLPLLIYYFRRFTIKPMIAKANAAGMESLGPRIPHTDLYMYYGAAFITVLIIFIFCQRYFVRRSVYVQFAVCTVLCLAAGVLVFGGRFELLSNYFYK